jgi:hypothetical protein
MSNSKKAETLGMPHGTANGRLRKNILFHLLTRLKENVCFKCRKEIQTVDELSIEHKLPWEGRSAELFWDLNNIAFSHLVCNKPHSYTTNEDKRKVGPEGTAWCIGHQQFLSVDLFYKKSTRWNGFQKNCKDCHDHQQGHGIIRGRISKSVAGVSGSISPS